MKTVKRLAYSGLRERFITRVDGTLNLHDQFCLDEDGHLWNWLTGMEVDDSATPELQQ